MICKGRWCQHEQEKHGFRCTVPGCPCTRFVGEDEGAYVSPVLPMLNGSFRTPYGHIVSPKELDFFNFVRQHGPEIGYGCMMQIIAEYWREIDPLGALTIGECAGVRYEKPTSKKNKKA